MKKPIGAIIFSLFTLPAWGGMGPDSRGHSLLDKSHFSLLHPTPRTAMRELSTDRPDQTESAYTIDAGHVQIEMDLLKVTHDRANGDVTASVAFAPFNFKIGLTNNIDIQLVYGSYEETRTGVGSERHTVKGWSDLTTRLKINLWGNDGGTTALALMPYIKAPLGSRTISNGAVEAGLIIPFAINVSDTVGIGLMSEVDWVASEDGHGHHLEWLNSATIGVDFTKRIGGYVEIIAIVSNDGAPWVGQFDFGMTFALTDDIQLDAGCNFGFTESAPDYQPFVGLSVRF